MGCFTVKGEVQGIRGRKKSVSVRRLLVDTGTEFTWIPADVLQRAGVSVAKEDVPFVMANGKQITRSTGYALIRSPGFETVDEVVFGQKGDMTLLGARTLEGFGADVDSRKKRLVATTAHLAAPSD